MLLSFTSKRLDLLGENLKDKSLKCLSVHPFARTTSRLKYKPDLLNYTLISETIEDLLSSNSSHLSWEECCASRAKEFMTLNKDTYFLSYSGGIDSSVALISFLEYWPWEFQSRLVIYMNHESIRENPDLFVKYVKNLKWTTSFADISETLLQQNAIFITGELGDQLFGSDILGKSSNTLGDVSLFENFRTTVPQYIKLLKPKLSEQEVMRIFDHILPIVDECPFPVRTTHDFFWWWNFTQKWQYVKLRFAERREWNLNARYGTHVQHFFDSVEFQKWSIENHDKKIENDWASYKKAAKDFLAQKTRLCSIRNLVKVQSLYNSYAFSQRRAGITSQWKEATNEDIFNAVQA